MYEAVQTCKHCGANLTLDDMRKTHCPYCGSVYPHHAMASQHANVINQVLQQQGMGHIQISHQYGGGATPGNPLAGVQMYGQPHQQYVQSHVDNAHKMVKTSLIIVGVVVLLMIFAAVAVVLIAVL
jgi:predicted RNA-binding Zn-ribbon protein involved in translation (DUF1610 family)